MKLIIANWKMNPQKEADAVKLARATDKKGVVIAAPFVYLIGLKKILKNAKLAAQDLFFEDEGSYTGEISPKMLKSAGVKFVILGHSERRALGETNEEVNKKIISALRAGVTPVACVGERDRSSDMNYLHFIKNQIRETFAGISRASLSKIIIAYEPVWAIGRKAIREATPAEAHEMAIFIKRTLSDMFGSENVGKTKIIYGGSVNPNNAGDFLQNGGVDGLLVGRDSLDPKKFNEIIKKS